MSLEEVLEESEESEELVNSSENISAIKKQTEELNKKEISN